MPTGVYERPVRVCSIEDCGKKHTAKGLCSMHYYRVRTHGDPHLKVENSRWKNRVWPETQVCRLCGEEKPLSEFLFRVRYGTEFHEKDCLSCSRERKRQWAEENKERVALRQAEQRARKAYGERGVEISRRIRAGESCEVCGNRTRLMATDHDHETGQVRGLLCSNCNTALGLVREDVDLLMSLAAYVLSHQDVLAVSHAV